MTFFEVTTAAAMLAFSRHPADLLFLETGLGGALDSTNVLTAPLATIITPIARDHEHFLGTSLTGIAEQKAGIMRPGTPCFSAAQSPEVAKRYKPVLIILARRSILPVVILKSASKAMEEAVSPCPGQQHIFRARVWLARIK